jgi:hypothetical protein
MIDSNMINNNIHALGVGICPLSTDYSKSRIGGVDRLGREGDRGELGRTHGACRTETGIFALSLSISGLVIPLQRTAFPQSQC